MPKKYFKGGEIPTHLGKGQDGFDHIKSFESTYKEGDECSFQVGRDEIVGETEMQNAGRGTGK